MYVQTICSHFTTKPFAKMKSSKARNFPALQNIEGETQVATISDSNGVQRRGQPLESDLGPCILDSSGKYQLCPFLRANEQEIPETQATDQNSNSNPKADNKEEQKDKSKEPPEEKKNRCHKCGKKLGLTGAFPCRCGGIYCAVHRYSDRHECSFDYREMGASEIRRDNPVTVAKKLPEI
ncbi:AN1-type zinc finger protein 6 [Drosophila obscura]|uniref:AN1-type zinc finger protein 6 n=1 Tax=Drosophila obscura TaxID=7282 RepID=UPI001BB0F9BB|nr:AN1-type zinc finger protein 6 [Drosophila obscura]